MLTRMELACQRANLEGSLRLRMWEYWRLSLAVLCLAISLTAIVKAPNLPIWMLSLGATEFGHWFALVPLALLCVGQSEPISVVGSGVAAVSMALFLSTAFRAHAFGRSLPQQLGAAFGEVTITRSPLSVRTLFFGNGERAIRPETLIYSEGVGYSLRLNFFRSTRTDSPSPCVIVLHTGGWNSGTPDEFGTFSSHLAHRGYAVAALQYRLAPDWSWPSPREDVAAALAFLKERSAELGIDPTRFGLLGRSAGGHIAEASAYSLNDPAIRGCIAFYAPADVHYAYQLGRDDDMLKSRQIVRSFMGGSPEERPEQYDSASANLLVRADTPPTLLFHGPPDPLVWNRQSQRLAAGLRREGVPHLLIEFPWATHAFDFNPYGPGGQLSAYAVDFFLAARLPRAES